MFVSRACARRRGGGGSFPTPSAFPVLRGGGNCVTRSPLRVEVTSRRPLFLLLWLCIPSGFLVVFEKPNRSSFTFTFTITAARAAAAGPLCRFSSLFPDTDRFFGSVGSFFQLPLAGGSFEVNPPFDSQSVLLCIDRMVEVRSAVCCAPMRPCVGRSGASDVNVTCIVIGPPAMPPRNSRYRCP